MRLVFGVGLCATDCPVTHQVFCLHVFFSDTNKAEYATVMAQLTGAIRADDFAGKYNFNAPNVFEVIHFMVCMILPLLLFFVAGRIFQHLRCSCV